MLYILFGGHRDKKSHAAEASWARPRKATRCAHCAAAEVGTHSLDDTTARRQEPRRRQVRIALPMQAMSVPAAQAGPLLGWTTPEMHPPGTGCAAPKASGSSPDFRAFAPAKSSTTTARPTMTGRPTLTAAVGTVVIIFSYMYGSRISTARLLVQHTFNESRIQCGNDATMRMHIVSSRQPPGACI